MRSKLYYPYINIKDEDFLKYAILYYDKLNLIVPESRRFNDKMSMVSDSTDLFVKIKPEQSYQTCCDATKYTIAFIDERMRMNTYNSLINNLETLELNRFKDNIDQYLNMIADGSIVILISCFVGLLRMLLKIGILILKYLPRMC